MMNYEVEMEQWSYKGTDKNLLANGFNCFYYYWPKKVAIALWKYDVWGNLWNKDAQITYVQTWAWAINDMHSYPFTSLNQLAHYLIKEEGYSYADLVTLGYDSVNAIEPTDKIWVWEYDCSLRSYAKWTNFLWDFDDHGNWDAFVSWATNAYGNSSVEAFKMALKVKENGVHLDYMEMLGDYFGPMLHKLEGEKHDWFIRRIMQVYQVGTLEAEDILQGPMINRKG